MDNDIISRSALKAELTSETRDKFVFVCLSQVLEKIDNAPPVEQECYITGEQWNQFMQEHRRPQGKWLHPYVTDIACECSNCHRQMPITDYYNFCPNCGAEMKRESENE